jgi:hypothetical protein
MRRPAMQPLLTPKMEYAGEAAEGFAQYRITL